MNSPFWNDTSKGELALMQGQIVAAHDVIYEYQSPKSGSDLVSMMIIKAEPR